jgi:hypothetical protein
VPRPRRAVALAASVLAVAASAVLAPSVLRRAPSTSAPVSADDAAYQRCGRVFPDPHAYWPAPAPPAAQSPWAKGNAVCKAVDFLGWDETIAGLRYLESKLPRFIDVVDLSDPDNPFAAVLDESQGEGRSAGLPTESLGREHAPMYVVRVTDEASTQVPIDERAHFAYTLSIHGIERAGIEGGIRAIEDLVTWAACEDDSGALPTCGVNGPYPHPIMETMPNGSIGAGEALRRSSLWFVLANPDGWRRGDKATGRFFYQRYNGNGMDLNRDWPSLGYTFRPYTPFSEPETRGIGKVLKNIKSKWTGGLDLHGQLVDRAFSFTLMSGSQRDYGKDRRILQYVKGAYEDAEARLRWSPVIKPNDAPPSCLIENFDPPNCDATPRVYGVQWGTVWDTIAYSTTGSVSEWMDSAIGLGGDGIGNEMSMSHLGNCGVGTCYLPEFEQLHVDGNKSLIYALVHYSLVPEDDTFAYKGTAAWLHHDDRVRNAGSSTAAAPAAFGLPPQPGFEVDITATPSSPGIHEFEVKGPSDGVYNGAISAELTSTNLTGVSPNAAAEIAIDKYKNVEEDPNAPEEGWAVQNSYYNQAPVYLQAGARVDVNSPLPGRYRIRITGPVAGVVRAKVRFLSAPAWPDPGQIAYDVSNLDFFRDLVPFVQDGSARLKKAPLDDVLSGKVDLSSFDSLVIADGAFPAVARPAPAGARATPQAPVTSDVTLGPPVFGMRTEQTSSFVEFDVEGGHSSLHAELTAATGDPDLYVQRRQPDGTWSDDIAAGSSGQVGRETLTYEEPPAGRYRVEVVNVCCQPATGTLTVSFAVPSAEPAPSARYTADDEARLLGLLRAFVEGGGNLVLTDDALRVVERLGLVPKGAVQSEKVYAAHVQFSTDGGQTSTYGDPLAARVHQPGAAEGPGHRHQMAESVPLGYQILDADGFDTNTVPQWTVDPAEWEKAGGRTVGMANGRTTFGELVLGKGDIRVIGGLLPRPTAAYDHPFGIASYAVTYSGYEAFRNMLDIATPRGGTRGGGGGQAGSLPSTGSSPWSSAWPAVLLSMLAALVVAIRRSGPRRV